MAYYKRLGASSTPLIIISKQPELLTETLHRIREENRNPKLTAAINKIMSKNPTAAPITWMAVSMKRPEEILRITPLTPSDVSEWRESKKYRSDDETVYVDLVKARLENVKCPVEKAHRDLCTHLTNKGYIKGVPVFLNPRLFYIPATSEPQKSISPNSNWHIDFLGRKPFDEVDMLLTYEGYQYICTVTEEGGPTTLVLDVDAIELPILEFTPQQRSWLLGAYIQTLIDHGVVTFHALPSNIWHRVDTRLLHRGPLPQDAQFTPSDRAFFHVKL